MKKDPGPPVPPENAASVCSAHSLLPLVYSTQYFEYTNIAQGAQIDSDPLMVRSGPSSMGPNILKSLEHGFASDETDPGNFWIRKKDGRIEKLDVSPDPIESLVDAFNSQPPDMWQTSGHATEKDWQTGYNVKAGSFRCRNGVLERNGHINAVSR